MRLLLFTAVLVSMSTLVVAQEADPVERIRETVAESISSYADEIAATQTQLQPEAVSESLSAVFVSAYNSTATSFPIGKNYQDWFIESIPKMIENYADYGWEGERYKKIDERMAEVTTTGFEAVVSQSLTKEDLKAREEEYSIFIEQVQQLLIDAHDGREIHVKMTALPPVLIEYLALIEGQYESHIQDYEIAKDVIVSIFMDSIIQGKTAHLSIQKDEITNIFLGGYVCGRMEENSVALAQFKKYMNEKLSETVTILSPMDLHFNASFFANAEAMKKKSKPLGASRTNYQYKEGDKDFLTFTFHRLDRLSEVP